MHYNFNMWLDSRGFMYGPSPVRKVVRDLVSSRLRSCIRPLDGAPRTPGHDVNRAFSPYHFSGLLGP
jgi:hypothetical protein